MGTTPKAASRLEAAHHRRGPSVCSNNLTIPMEQADDAVLCAIEDVVLAPAIVDSVVDQVIEQVQAARGANRRPAIEREMATIEQEISRLAGAIASGGDVPASSGPSSSVSSGGGSFGRPWRVRRRHRGCWMFVTFGPRPKGCSILGEARRRAA